MEATLHGLSKIEPGATVDVAVLTEGRWEGLVDETGMPVDWDIPNGICSQLGLHCIQVTESDEEVIVLGVIYRHFLVHILVIDVVLSFNQPTN